MLNVLYICPSSGIGGAETFIKNTAIGHRSEHINPIYLLFGPGPLLDFLQSQNKKVMVLSQRPHLSRPSHWLSTTRQIRKIIVDQNIQLVHSTMAYGALFTALATVRLCPHVWFQHGPASGWQDTLAGILPHQGLITNSKFTTETQICLEKHVSSLIPNRQYLQLNLGVSLEQPSEKDRQDFKQQLIQKHHLNSETTIVSMLCRIQDWKGIHHFIDAIAILQKKYSQQQLFAIVWGEPFPGSEDYFLQLQQKSKNLPLHFAGSIKNVALALYSSDCVVNASTQPEPFGLSLIEAMACKAIPIAANWGGPQEIIQNQENGLLFKPNSPQDLAAQIEMLLANKKLRSELKENAFKTFKEKYQCHQMVEKLEAFYNLLCSKKPT